ncbi:unnamed protein product [Euphydryas editha]|uniref:Uncharacterized protein n=1 Tax=Euphydryas editha TaxID=104508 RepID=A0AAU9TLT6_EUPED|nr:unnamed protein product [Euphydryas editha]
MSLIAKSALGRMQVALHGRPFPRSTLGLNEPRARTRAPALAAPARDGCALIDRASRATAPPVSQVPHVPTAPAATPVPTRVLCYKPSRTIRTRAGKFTFNIVVAPGVPKICNCAFRFRESRRFDNDSFSYANST